METVTTETVKSEFGFATTVYHTLPNGDVIRVRSPLRHAQDNFAMVTLNGRYLDSGLNLASANAKAKRLIEQMLGKPTASKRPSYKQALVDLLAWLEGDHDDDSALSSARQLVA